MFIHIIKMLIIYCEKYYFGRELNQNVFHVSILSLWIKFYT